MKRRRRGPSEEEREELARERRERARRARADLAAKAKGEDPKRDEMADEKDDSEAEVEAKATGKPDAKSKPAGDRKRKPDAKSKSAPDGKRKPDAKSKPKPEVKRKPDAKSKSAPDGKRKPDAKSKPKPEVKRKPARKRQRGGAKRAGKGALVALKQGATETGKRARTAAPKAGGAFVGLIVGAFAIFFAGLGFVLRALIAAYRFVAPPVLAALRIGGRAIDAVSRQVTPVRVLALVVAGAAVLLALSQFADYRNITIGNDAYADGIQTVAPAPVRETDPTGSAHSYLMIPVAAVALILLGAALTGRWRLCRLIALAGLLAIAVGLLHDRPTGLDTGDESLSYTGVEATLLGGFYAQLFAGLLLTLSSLLLGRELRLAGAQRPARASRGSRARRRLQRRDPRVEGARA